MGQNVWLGVLSVLLFTTVVAVDPFYRTDYNERFIFTFLSNAFYEETHGRLFIAPISNTAASGTVKLPCMNFTRYFWNVQPGNYTIVDLPYTANPIGTGEQPTAVVVEANTEVVVYGIHFRPHYYSEDSFVAIPIRDLGDEYYIASYTPLSHWSPVFAVTAVQNDTDVTIRFNRPFRFEGITYNPNRPLVLSMSKYQSYQFETSFDPTGTYITSTKPISVMSGAECANVPRGVGRCDHLLEQLPPVTSWGQLFTLAPFPGRSSGYVVRIIGSVRETEVSISGYRRVLRVNEGAFIESNFISNKLVEISANRPILVVQYMKGTNDDRLHNGDPSMTIIPSRTQARGGDIIFPAFNIEEAYVSVHLTRGLARDLLLDGQTTQWNIVGRDSVDAVILQAPILPGYHVLSHRFASARLSAIVSGNAHQVSYAHPAAYQFQKIPSDGAICRIWGDPHYMTFDGCKYSFQGECTYTLVKTCGYLFDLQPFHIYGNNYKFKPSRKFSLLQSIGLEYGGKLYELLPNDKVRVDGKKYKLPYINPEVSIYYARPHKILMTEFGLYIRLDKNYDAEIRVPIGYKGKTCGLCGTYDGNPGNDFVDPSGYEVSSADEFGMRWVVDYAEDCKDIRPVSPCKEGSANQRQARAECGVLKYPQGPFRNCHDVVDPTPFFETCVYDICSMLPDKQMVCNNIEQYAQACREAGGSPANWRSRKPECEFECPNNTVYNSCGVGCQPTCMEFIARSDCPVKCIETCECAPGFVLDGLECVSRTQCGCPLPDGGYISEGEKIMFDDCSAECECIDGTLECVEVECHLYAECTVKNGVRGCFCTEGYVGNGTFCEMENKVCRIFGDPHFMTYDGAMYSYPGKCKYDLTKTCSGTMGGLPNFRIQGDLVAPYEDILNSTQLNSVRFVINYVGYTFNNEGKATIDGAQIESFPYTDDNGVLIYYNYPNLILMTDFGVTVTYNIEHHGTADIEIPPDYFGKMCGLCGNADGDADNDYRNRRGNLIDEPIEFANSWKVGPCSNFPTPEPHPCESKPEVYQSALDFCAFLIDPYGPLSQCYDYADPQPFYEACLYDLCAVYPERKLMCDIAMHYADKCNRVGGRAGNWRAEVTDCTMACPNATSYEPCAVGCPATCAVPELDTFSCPKKCIETCACPTGRVLDGERCVKLFQCRCPNPNGGMFAPGAVSIDEDCTVKCQCIDGQYSCFNLTCSENSICESRNGIKDCYCKSGFQGDGRDCVPEGDVCTPSWLTPRGNFCYGFFANAKPYDQAQRRCQQLGGNLVTIQNQQKNTFIGRIARGTPAWIGAKRDMSINIDMLRSTASYRFNYIADRIPSGVHRIEFGVRARKNAHIVISSRNGDANRMYEIVIGGWENTKSVIRRCKGCDALAENITTDILSNTVEKRFFITFHDGTIEVGLVGDGSFLSWTDPNPLPCNYVGFTTAYNSGRWRFYQNFVWVSGAPWIYENWRRGEPSNYNGEEACVEINYVNYGLWNDQECNTAKSFVCEIPIE